MTELRPYQSRAIDGFMASAARRVVIVAPCGAGKTTIGAAICTHYHDPLWLAPRIELVDQARARVPGARVETIQSLLGKPRQPCDLLVIDEAHHVSNGSEWQQIAESYSDVRHLLLTATPQRGDGRPMGDVADELIVAASYSQLLADGHLVPCDVAHVEQSARRDGLAQDPLAAWIAHADGRQGFGYAGRVELAREWSAQFDAAGVASRVIDASTPSDERAATVEAFRGGALRCLWSVGTLTEGVDVPAAAVCLIARPVGSCGLWLQIAGRVLRPHPGKDRALVIDLCGSYWDWGPPTLDREYSLSGDAISARPETLRQCRACGYCAPPWCGPCPQCGHASTTPPLVRPTIYNAALARCWVGSETPTSAKLVEWARLKRIVERKQADGDWFVDLIWAAGKYRKLFDEPVPDSHDEIKRLLARKSQSKKRDPDGWYEKRVAEYVGGEPYRVTAPTGARSER